MRTCYQNFCRGTETVNVALTLKSVCNGVIEEESTTQQIYANRCTTAADEVRLGDVFFALPGDDAAENIGIAVHRGAAAVVAESEYSVSPHTPLFKVPNVAVAYAGFCQALYDDPGKSLKMIAVTGTSGKTSTTYLAAGVFSEAGEQTGLISSLGIFDGLEFHHIPEEQFSPEILAAYLYRMMMNGCTYAVVEVSSKMIACGVLGGIKFDAVCLTNIRKNHLDIHGTVEQYRRCKLDILKYAKKRALVVCNADDPITGTILPFIKQPVLTVGIRNRTADVSATLIEQSLNEQTFLVTAAADSIPMRTVTIGSGHIYSCLAAAALGIGFDTDLAAIARGIERIENIPARMERIECRQEFNVFIDAASTADSLSAALHTLRTLTAGRLICVFGAADDRDTTKHSALAKVLKMLADRTILTSATDEHDAEAVDAICGIGRNFTDQYGATVFPNRADAISWALTEAESGDTVLIIGRGKTDIAVSEFGITPFCDRSFTRQWLDETLDEVQDTV